MLRDSGALCYVTQAMAGTSSSDILTLRREADEALAHAASVDAELARAHAIIADLEARNALIALQKAQMRRALYGHRSERSTRPTHQPVLTFAHAQPPAAQDEALVEAAAHAASVDAELARAHAIIADLEARNALIELQNAQMRRALYGHRAERSTRLIDQLELTFADAEETAGEDEALGEVAARHTAVEAHLRERPARRAFPEHLPRERVVVAPPAACPCCGSDDLSKLGEDVTETLEIGRAHV